MGPIQVRLNDNLHMAQDGLRLFSAMSDSYFKFGSDRKLTVMTTSYTRIRIPIIVMVGDKAIEKLVIMSSHDRTVVVAKGSREINSNVLGDYEYNTPIVLYFAERATNISVQVHSSGGVVNNHEVRYVEGQNRFIIPNEIDIKSASFTSHAFDAPMPSKNKRK